MEIFDGHKVKWMKYDQKGQQEKFDQEKGNSIKSDQEFFQPKIIPEVIKKRDCGVKF